MRSTRLPFVMSILLPLLSGVTACSGSLVGERVGDELVLKSRYGEAWVLLTDPTEVGTLTSTFGYRRHPITGLDGAHRGIDLAAPTGTPVVAAEDGVVLFQGDRGTYGNLSKIKHGRDVVTAYAHLDRFELGLLPGTFVNKGQVIGYVGTSGRSSGPHLHYEVILHGQWIDPLGLKESQLAEPVERAPKKAKDTVDIAIR